MFNVSEQFLIFKTINFKSKYLSIINMAHHKYESDYINRINETIKQDFFHLKPIEPDYYMSMDGISRKVMLDRYSQKDKNLISLSKGDLILTTIHFDNKFPAIGIGRIVSFNKSKKSAHIKIEEDAIGMIDENLLVKDTNDIIEQPLRLIDKPLELYYEQIAFRVAGSLASQESNFNNIFRWHKVFFEHIRDQKIVPAGRVLHGAGSDSEVTLFNCFVLPFIKDSRDGIAYHRQQVAEIMSRGGGVGTNGSTLRPRGSIAKTVGGRSSGAVSWLNDISTLTHLVIQGGSRRGAQMIMLDVSHPDIIEFVVSKMQNLKVLLWLKNNFTNPLINREVTNKLKFKKLSNSEINMYEEILANPGKISESVIEMARAKLSNGGNWEVTNADFLMGANISVTLTNDFIEAVKNDDDWNLVYPDLESYTPEEKAVYDKEWHEIGDPREWKKRGFAIKTYHTFKAHELWDLINICANYSAEPGIFFIDRANEMTNASSYNMKVVATNPCAEQPLAAYSVCNLSAINLSKFVNKKTSEILYDDLAKSVAVCVRMQDNTIDATHYFCEKNKKQAKGERRVGLGVMGLHDLLIFAGHCYGSAEGNKIVDKVFKIICESAYKTSSLLASEKGSFPFLKGRNDKFIETGFMKTMSQEIKDLIMKNGIRNSHLLTIAPTGSTGTMIGCSTGLEPYYTFETHYRSGRLGKMVKILPPIIEEYKKYHPEVTEEDSKKLFVGSMDLTPKQHVMILCLIQRWIDSSISKTINAPSNFTVRDVQKIYMMLYDNKAKGGTVYVDGSRDSQVLSLTTEENNLDEVSLLDLGLEFNNNKTKNTMAKKIKSNPNLKTPLKSAFNAKTASDVEKIGTDINDVCPVCQQGRIVMAGGCSTCTSCQAQLKCET